jgi:hypothetical protein
MTRKRLVRRVLASLAIAGASVGAVAAVAPSAGAQVPTRIHLYQLTPTEYGYLCGPNGPYRGVVEIDGGAQAGGSGMTLDCNKGQVAYSVQ